ncbi:MAG TPA: glycosyltransferase family 4 protein [Coleofasciculaceae cyanobacterium]
MLSIGDHPPSVLAATPVGRRLRIGMVLDQPFPPDARVEREATALVEAGYEVHLLCAFRPEDTLKDEAYRGIYLHRVDPEAVTTRIPLLDISTRLPYRGLFKNYFHHFKNIDIAWHTMIDRFVTGYGIDILHIHDLRLVPTGLDVARRHRLPLVADLHENYPALMQMMKGRNNPKRGLAQRKRWEAIEQDCIHRAEQIIVVAEEAKKRLMGKGVPAKKILTLENTVDIEKFEAAPIDPEIVRRFKAAFLLCYVGHLNDMHRGIQTVIEAMGILRDEIPELQFIGAGAIREPYRQKLEPMIQGAKLSERVHFTGWLDETEFVSYIEASDICLCPHIVNDHTNATFPNKVYLYNLFKRPIIASNAVPLQRYLEETEGGLVFESGNAQMLADRIRELYYQPELRRKVSQSGHDAVRKKHNWQESAKGLIATYNALATAHGAVIVR